MKTSPAFPMQLAHGRSKRVSVWSVGSPLPNLVLISSSRPGSARKSSASLRCDPGQVQSSPLSLVGRSLSRTPTSASKFYLRGARRAAAAAVGMVVATMEATMEVTVVAA